MNKNEKDVLLQVIDKLARIEERIALGFKANSEDHKEMKQHISTINDEMGSLKERISEIESLYFNAKTKYEKMSMYWKVIAFLLSPLITFLIIAGVKIILGLPIP